ncbi:multiple epidermal growth factor-like domains protein 8 isoform X4 [Convolutriloba macropyga]|uniref:multiple epidermal growth factor-like domains protein 8 isoform X4 n=1 Tax=Convolutriloba macropyga TaxID=536237 RepID=UPI003F51DD1C
MGFITFCLSFILLNSVSSISLRTYIDGNKYKTGVITDGAGAYTANTHAEWLIEAKKRESIMLQFNELVTECSFDYVFVYDGRTRSQGSKLLASISGSFSPSVLYANSGSMLIVFFTDQNSNRPGFNATYKVSMCPNDCRTDLHHNHMCTSNANSVNYYCDCKDGIYEGVDCSIPACPESCGYQERRGECRKDTNPVQPGLYGALNPSNSSESWKCFCENRRSVFIGESCILEMDKEKNYQTWTRLFSNKRRGPVPVVGADAVVIRFPSDPSRNKLYVFGGYDLTNVISSFFAYDIYKSEWSVEVPMSSSSLPEGRAFHTMTLFGQSKIAVIGGVLKFEYSSKDDSGRMERSVWVYDTISKLWTEYNTPFRLGLADHTATLVDHQIFVIGGRFSDDTFNNLIYVLDTNMMTWETRSPNGYPGLQLRRVGHSTVYDRKRKAILIFGGYLPSTPNFSKKTNDLLAYSPAENYLSLWDTVEREKGAKPDNIAHHSAVIMGNYMVVFGGSMQKAYSEQDSCVMNQTYLFHLDCHMWIDKDRVLIGQGGENYHKLANFASKLQIPMEGLSTTLHAAPPRKGHVAVLLDENLMAIFGGYDGTARSDIYVYKAPPSVFDEEEEAHCREASSNETLCHQDPKCFYCESYRGGTTKACISKETLERNSCGVPATRAMCPGVCGSMTDCKSCLLFGEQECAWCSATQSCLNRTDAKESQCPRTSLESKNPGIITLADSCKYDFPNGFVQTTFFQPENPRFPDYVTFSVAPDVRLYYNIEKDPRYDVSMLGPKKHSPIVVELKARLVNMKSVHDQAPKYQVLLINNNMTFTLTRPDESFRMIPTLNMTGSPVPVDISINRTYCRDENRGCVVKVRLEIPVINRQGSGRMTLYWNGDSQNSSVMAPLSIYHAKPFHTSERDCPSVFFSCLTCTGEGVGYCGWDPALNQCTNKWEGEDQKSVKKNLVIYPHHCTTCTDFIDCDSCNSQPGCVWAKTSTSVQCLRRPPPDVLEADSRVAKNVQKYSPVNCSTPCNERSSCAACFQFNGNGERFSECSWCESLQKCLPFYMYLPAYSYGICKSYSEKNTPNKCPICGMIKNCQECLSTPGCGFCEDSGACVRGNFDGPLNSCIANVTSTSKPSSSVMSRSSSARSPAVIKSLEFNHNYHFAQCPQRNECVDEMICEMTKKGSICIDTNDSQGYECQCPKGMKDAKIENQNGEFIDICEQTCVHPCIHGECEKNRETNQFECYCNKGYYGRECNLDCGCLFRSTCSRRGVCDKCDDGYTGRDCSLCSDGYYQDGNECKRCNCSGNGDPKRGECNKSDGKCFCINNTDGYNCEKCKESAGYYSKPSEGNTCYKMCTGWAIMSSIDGISYIGSEQGDGAKNPDRVVCIWQISTKDDPSPKSPAISGGSKITFEITAMNVECNHQYVYVYENTPSFLTGEGGTSDSSMNTDNHQRDKILGAFCGRHSHGHKRVVEAESTITVVFKANVTEGDQFFNAKITVHKQPCSGNWISRGDDSCECPTNMTGWNCDQVTCPNNCSVSDNQGACVVGDDDRYFCSCHPGFTGSDCSQRITHESGAQFTTLLPGTFAREAKYGRHGHTIVVDKSKKYIYIIGGRNFVNSPVDMIKYSIEENKLTTVRTEFLIIPYRGYYHTSAITDSDTVYVFGGLQQMDHKCSRTFWHFIPDAKAQNDKLQMSPVSKDDYPAYSEPGHSWIPTVAQHTMNYIKLPSKDMKEFVELLIIIGGYSPEHGFNNYTLQYNIKTKAWSAVPTEGTKPIGIFGHTTVWYEEFHTFYVYGGYVYSKNSVYLSNELYALTYTSFNDDPAVEGGKARWTVVYPKGLTSRLSAIAFHQSVVVGDYMVVLGGRTETQDFTNEVRIYVITCNAWIVEGQSIPDTGVFSGIRFDPVIGHSAVAIGNDIYIYGGFNGVTFQSMNKLSMPEDICNLMHGSRNRHECERITGCSFCRAKQSAMCGGSNTCCFNVSNYKRDDICERSSIHKATDQCYIKSSVYNHWPPNFRAPCSQHNTCAQCLSQYLSENRFSHRKEQSSCKWCPDRNWCIDREDHCDPSGSGVKDFTEPELCTQYNMCMESDCGKCYDSGECVWSRHLSYEKSDQSKVIVSVDSPEFVWGCFPKFIHNMIEPVAKDSGSCPAPCHSYENCSSCLNSGGADGGWKQCYWAQELNECISPTFADMQCAAGECGRVVKHSAEGCPKVCEDQTQCSTCAQMTHCGWCSLQSGSEMLGLGACWEGGLNGPRQQRCTSDSVISHLLSKPKNHQIGTYILFSLRGHSWSHSSCPPENECDNAHHDCDYKTQECVDLTENFECKCKKDYLKNEETGECQPQCNPPCSKNGECVEPNECRCKLGFKGPQCETSCPCHGHSVCSDDAYNPCLKCQHNTSGRNCDRCVSKYYGNATTGTANACIKCSSLCSGKSDYCIQNSTYHENFKMLSDESEILRVFEREVQVGPEANTSGARSGEVVCILCQNHTSGKYCEKCEDGYYKDEESGGCVPCQCNGHAIGNKCNSETGMECDCQGHTKNPEYCKSPHKDDSGLRKSCSAVEQCSKCDGNEYLGTPSNGRQCYRVMECWMDTFHISPDNQIYDDIPLNEKFLKPGQASFFYVKPAVRTGQQMHRVVVEIHGGAVDLYVSDDPLMVKMDISEGPSTVSLYDANGRLIPPTKRKQPRKSSSGQLTGTRLPPASSGQEIMQHAIRSKRAANDKPELVAERGPNNTYEIKPKVRGIYANVSNRQSMYVMNAEFNSEKKAMYVNIRSQKTVLIATNVSGRFEVLLPVNEDSEKSIREGRPKKKYFFTIHNNQIGVPDADKSNATGIVYQIQSEVKFPITICISFIVYFCSFVTAGTLSFMKLYKAILRGDNENASQNSENVSQCPTVQINFHFQSQIDPVPDQFDKKLDTKTKYMSLPSKKSRDKSFRNIQSLGRQIYCAKTLCLQPFRAKREAPMTVMFETPSGSNGQRFFFGTAIVQYSSKTKRNPPEIIPTTPTSAGALNNSSVAFFTQRSDSQMMSRESLVPATSNPNYSTLPNNRLGHHNSFGSVSNNMYADTQMALQERFASLSRGAPGINRHQIYGQQMVPRSGSMANTPMNMDSAQSTINRSSLNRNSMPRSQTFSQRNQINLSPTATSFI